MTIHTRSLNHTLERKSEVCESGDGNDGVRCIRCGSKLDARL